MCLKSYKIKLLFSLSPPPPYRMLGKPKQPPSFTLHLVTTAVHSLITTHHNMSVSISAPVCFSCPSLAALPLSFSPRTSSSLCHQEACGERLDGYVTTAAAAAEAACGTLLSNHHTLIMSSCMSCFLSPLNSCVGGFTLLQPPSPLCMSSSLSTRHHRLYVERLCDLQRSQ